MLFMLSKFKLFCCPKMFRAFVEEKEDKGLFSKFLWGVKMSYSREKDSDRRRESLFVKVIGKWLPSPALYEKYCCYYGLFIKI